jgi:hypothetical protein
MHNFCVCVCVAREEDGLCDSSPLLEANVWFMSTDPVRDGRRDHGDTPHCFHTLWPALCLVTPRLRGCIHNITQEDVSDLLFSLSREYARRDVGPSYYD